MQLNQTTNHAIRIILLLTKSNAVVSSNTIAEKTNLSRRYLFRITSRLRDAGLISVTRGPEGGYELQKPPAEISVYDILHTLEGPILLPEYGADQNRHAALSAVYSFLRIFLTRPPSSSPLTSYRHTPTLRYVS